MNNFWNKIRYWDYHIYKFLHGAIAGRPWLNESYLFFAKYGIVIIFLSSIYLISRRRINAFIAAFLAMGLAAFVDLAITLIWKRQRPFIAHSNEIITPITKGLHVDIASFPSAHTYIAFAIATAVFLYGHKKLGTFLFLVALLVGIGRIGAGLHYPSDVVAGALLGILSGVGAYLIVHGREHKWE